MTPAIRPAVIRKELVVHAAPATAFRVFTDGFDRWWPRTHNLHPSPLVAAIIEPGAGGRWFSRHADGSEALWGEVLVWEPPSRAVLAWRISHEWGYDPDLLTEVDVRFEDLGDGTTAVRFEHRGLERFGDSAAARETVEKMNAGWGQLLDGYRTVAEHPEGDARAA